MTTSYRQIKWLWDRAVDFETAYRALPETPPPSWPRYFLLSHAIELALKSFLAAHGKRASDLKDLGHDLKKLVKEAVNRGLVLEPRTREDIELLSNAHTRHWARYPKEDGEPVIVIEAFETSASELFQRVRAAIFPPVAS